MQQASIEGSKSTGDGRHHTQLCGHVGDSPTVREDNVTLRLSQISAILDVIAGASNSDMGLNEDSVSTLCLLAGEMAQEARETVFEITLARERAEVQS